MRSGIELFRRVMRSDAMRSANYRAENFYKKNHETIKFTGKCLVGMTVFPPVVTGVVLWFVLLSNATINIADMGLSKLAGKPHTSPDNEHQDVKSQNTALEALQDRVSTLENEVYRNSM